MSKKYIVALCVSLTLVLSLGLTLTACGKSDTAHVNTWDTEWSNDADNHWVACTDEGCTETALKAAHTFGGWTTKTAATFEEDGVEERACTICGHVQTRAIAAKEHTYISAWSKDSAYHWHACVDEGYEQLQSGKASHTFGEWAVKTAATYDAQGIDERTCAICGHKETRVTSQLNKTATTAAIMTVDGKTYDGTAINLVKDTNYTTTGDGVVSIVWYNEDGSQTLPAPPVDAGTYQVQVIVAESATMRGCASAKHTVTISKKQIALVWGDNSDVTYDGQEHDISVEIEEGGVIPADASECRLFSSIAGYRVDAGTRTITVIGLGGEKSGNYEFVSGTVLTKSRTINKRPLSVAWTNTEFTYDGQPHAPTALLVGGVEGDVNLSVTVLGAQTNASDTEYTASASVTYTRNYIIESASTLMQNFKINHIIIDNVVWEDVTEFTFNGNIQKPNASIADGIILDGDVCNVSVTTNNTNGSIGEYTATISGLSGEDALNYKLADAVVKTKAYTIVEKEVRLTWITSLEYNGENQFPTYEVIGLLPNTTCLVQIDMEGEHKNVGRYNITGIALLNHNYKLAAGEGRPAYLDITAKNVTLTWGDTLLEYNGESQLPTVAVDGTVSDDTCTATPIIEGEHKNVATYNITNVTLSNGNYKFADGYVTTKVFKITPRIITLVSNEFVSDGSNEISRILHTEDGVIAGETLILRVKFDGTAVGSHGTGYSFMADSGASNYHFSSESVAKCVIVSAPE